MFCRYSLGIEVAELGRLDDGTHPEVLHCSAVSLGLGCARVSTGEQDLVGQVMRLESAGTARTFDEVILDRTIDRPGRG